MSEYTQNMVESEMIRYICAWQMHMLSLSLYLQHFVLLLIKGSSLPLHVDFSPLRWI